MKLAIDCRYLGNSGIGRVNQGFLENLASYRDQVDFVFLGDPEALKLFSALGDIVPVSSNPFSPKGLFLPKDAKKAVKQCDAFLSIGYIAPFGTRKPRYLFIHDCVFFDVPEATNGFLDKTIKRFFYKRAIRQAKTIFTVSNFSKERLVSLFKTKKPIEVVYNGVSADTDRYQGGEPTRDYFLYVGNFKKYKGLDVLLEAHALYRKNGGSLPLVIVGKEEGLRTSFHLEPNQLDGVRLTGYLKDEELLRYIYNAYCLVQPSRYEGFGIPPLEAMTLGTPCLLSDIQVFREVYGDAPVSFFKDGDAKDLEKALWKKPSYSKEEFQKWNAPSFKGLTDKVMATILGGAEK